MSNRIPIRFLSFNSKKISKNLHFFHNNSNEQAQFPCVDRIQTRQQKLEDDGPEPNYENLVGGYATSNHKEPLSLIHGGVLPEFTIAYESWGELNHSKDNVIQVYLPVVMPNLIL